MACQSSTFSILYRGSQDDTVGRRTALIQGICKYAVLTLNSGLLYTGFFMLYDIDIVSIGILIFAPYLAAILSFVSPLLLERFEKRKRLLMFAKGLYYFLSVFCITVLPELMHGSPFLIPLCVILIFAAYAVNNFCQAGVDAWFVSFLPENLRADHFASLGLIQAFIGQGIAFAASVVIDSISSQAQSVTLIAVRWLLLLIGFIEILYLSFAKEYPYPKTQEHIRFCNVFRLPLRNRKFLGTAMVYASFLFFYNMPNSTLNYYLLNDCGASFTFISAMDMLYPITMPLFLPIWKRYVRKISWIPAYRLVIILYAVSYLGFTFASASTYIPIMLIVRTLMHVAGAGNAVISSNLLYVNTPAEDTTNYLSFFTVCSNVFTAVGMLAGTSLVSAMGNSVFKFGLLRFAPTQIAMLTGSIGMFLLSLILHLNLKCLVSTDEIK